MKRLALLISIAAAAVALLVAPSSASAAISCPQTTITAPDANFDTVAVSWATTCNGAQWYFHMTLQYELGGVWHDADCVNSHPCDILRPANVPAVFYPAGASREGTINFDVVATNGCSIRWRAKQFIGTPNPPNPKISLTGPHSTVC